MPTYPRTVAECLEDRLYKPATLAAVREFRRSKPWQGTVSERKRKFRRLHAALCEVYGLTTTLDMSRARAIGGSGASCYKALSNRIELSGRLSVVTYLHEFAHALGYGEQGACRWSINLFRRMFPRSYARLNHSGHMLIASSNPERN